MLVNKSSISEIFINLKATFDKAFSAAPSLWQEIATEVKSTGSQNSYKWTSRFPKMRKWIGAKVIKSLEAFNYTLVNDDWEVTVEVDRNDIKDDNLGIYQIDGKMAGESAKNQPDELIFELVDGVFVNVCYDGQYDL